MEQPKSRDAKSAALRLLTVRDRSRRELNERLTRTYPSDDVKETLDYLSDIGYLDDLRYAQGHVAYRNRHRPSGNYLLRLELGSKGIKDEYIDQVLNSPEEEYNLAFALAKQRMGSLSKLDAVVRVRRLYSLLQRRGFPSGVARQVVGELLDRDLENEYN